jgi:hypothetical protein
LRHELVELRHDGVESLLVVALQRFIGLSLELSDFTIDLKLGLIACDSLNEFL